MGRQAEAAAAASAAARATLGARAGCRALCCSRAVSSPLQTAAATVPRTRLVQKQARAPSRRDCARRRRCRP
eukprot:3993673-Pleurochrysis_carterae.AAC.1